VSGKVNGALERNIIEKQWEGRLRVCPPGGKLMLKRLLMHKDYQEVFFGGKMIGKWGCNHEEKEEDANHKKGKGPQRSTTKRRIKWVKGVEFGCKSYR